MIFFKDVIFEIEKIFILKVCYLNNHLYLYEKFYETAIDL